VVASNFEGDQNQRKIKPSRSSPSTISRRGAEARVEINSFMEGIFAGRRERSRRINLIRLSPLLPPGPDRALANGEENSGPDKST